MEFHTGEDRSLTVTVTTPSSFADRDGQHVHTGFHTLLLDTVLGACAIGELQESMPIATIKLTCSHLHRLKIGEAISCKAIWDGEENEIAFLRGHIKRDADGKVISHAIGSFMTGTTSKPLASKS